MYRSNSRSAFPTRRLKQAGLSIISAIFMLLLLAALAAFMLTFSTVSNVTQAQDIQGSRAYWAANSGLQWGVYQVLQTNACATTTLTLSGFTVAVACTQNTYPEGGASVNIYRITATANQGTLGSAGYVERQLQATVGK